MRPERRGVVATSPQPIAIIIELQSTGSGCSQKAGWLTDETPRPIPSQKEQVLLPTHSALLFSRPNKMKMPTLMKSAPQPSVTLPIINNGSITGKKNKVEWSFGFLILSQSMLCSVALGNPQETRQARYFSYLIKIWERRRQCVKRSGNSF